MMPLPDFTKARVLVAGDVMLNGYWHGSTTRISPEAPVPVVQVQQIEARVGGAGNVAVNVAGLGARVRLLGLVGNDDAANQLEQMLIANKVQSNLRRVQGSSTINKLRIIGRHQQFIRLDFEGHFTSWQPDVLLTSFKDASEEIDIVIFSDYAKGALHGIQALIAYARSMQMPVIGDSKGTDFELYHGATLLTPNLNEFEAVVGHRNSEDELVDRAQLLRGEFDLHALLITRSEHGMSLFVSNQPPISLPTEAREVFDVTGAEDTVVAVIGAGLAAGLKFADAVVLGQISSRNSGR
jgi:D-beta-D-heptose 7-phosphate kinase/D-beta-D-heptose 1-phosphate adenosyltransferase